MWKGLRSSVGVFARVDHVLLAVVAASTAIRIALAIGFVGFHSGDDVEIIESGFRTAFGLAYQPWAIRNLLLPQALVAPALRLGSALGARNAAALVVVASLPFVALASLNVVLLWRLALRWSASRAIARIAVALYGLAWIPLGYGSMAYPRTVAVTCVLAGALVLSGQGRPALRGLAAGALLAVAFAARYSEVVFLVPLAACAWLSSDERRDRLRSLAGLLTGFLLGTLVTVGLIDALTWGRPFESLLAFAKYTLVEKQASTRVVSQPPWFYLGRLWFWLTPALWPALGLAGWTRRTRSLWWFVLAPLLLLSLIHHKELRYLQGLLPFVMLLGAIGIVRLQALGWRRTAHALLVVALLHGASGVRFVARKSMAAVEAARAIARDASVRTVALSQAWAYGDRLFLGDRIVIRDLPVPSGPDELAARIAGADLVGLYADDGAGDPALREVLHSEGLVDERRFTSGQSRAVIVFARRAAPADSRSLR